MNTNTVTDPRVDALIEQADEFAKPIVRRLRKLIQHTVPDATETIRSGFASFDYKGPFCSIGIFSNHINLGFWKQSLMQDTADLSNIKSEAELPADEELTTIIQQAAGANDKMDKPKLIQQVGDKQLPEDFVAALALNILANNAFFKLDVAAQQQFVSWVEEAQTDIDRTHRIEAALHQIAEGKTHEEAVKL